jgi:hypothetical protein
MRPGRVTLYVLLGLGMALVGVGAWMATRPHPTPGGPTEGESGNTPPAPAQSQPAPAQSPLPRGRRGVALLEPCLGRTVREVVQLLGLGDAERYWTDEPPGILRGASYFQRDGRSVTLYIAEGEPLFHRFSDRMEWDYEAFLKCRVGGIQYKAGEVHLDLGPAVPWQWRRP